MRPNFLIAGHVVYDGQSFKSVGILLKNKIFQLAKPIFYEYHQEYIKTDTICYDLSIYSIKGNFPDALILDVRQLHRNEKFSFFGYGEFNGHTREKSEISEVTISIADSAFIKPSPSQSISVNNCFGITDFLNTGDSGAPIFDDKGVKGMIIRGFPKNGTKKNGDPHGTIILKSIYIQSALDSISKGLK